MRVFAANSVGDSPASDEKSTTTPTDAAPGQVTGLTVTPWPSYKMDLEWNEPEDSTVTGYSISASYDGEEWESLTLDTGNTRTWYTDEERLGRPSPPLPGTGQETPSGTEHGPAPYPPRAVSTAPLNRAPTREPYGAAQ